MEMRQARFKVGDIRALDLIAQESEEEFAYRPKTCSGGYPCVLGVDDNHQQNIIKKSHSCGAQGVRVCSKAEAQIEVGCGNEEKEDRQTKKRKRFPNTTSPAIIATTVKKNQAKAVRYYAIAISWTPGIYTDSALALASHLGYRGAKYKRFNIWEGKDVEGGVWVHSQENNSADIPVMPTRPFMFNIYQEI
ncbi:hypothetical protein F4821DRAFT_275470 [Hypoxylon rubiginosum]|uniref:Uncharacterized protein n=1 Tax=Hypoxylon rubiginosum TaxID=110542 RepID=A0ACC0CKA5_9PEZI|nr:hypothetical protein F4821DRAFT_275470 [Hypoxylon rubiginosum]